MSIGKLDKAFLLEENRSVLAQSINFDKKTFLRLYKKNQPIIEKLNRSEFWNSKLYNDNKSAIEEHRYKLISSFICKLSQNKQIKVLDIGVGNGRIEELSQDCNIEFFGIDISEYAVRMAKRKFKGNFTKGNVINLGYKDNFFDVVIASEIIEHIPPHYTFLVLRNINRVLKTRGIFIVSVPLNENLKSLVVGKGINPNLHAREYTFPIINKELEISGFSLVRKVELYAFAKGYHYKRIIINILKKLRCRIFSSVKVNNLILFEEKIKTT